MKAKDYLSQYQLLQLELEMLEEEKARVNAMKTRITSAASDMPKSKEAESRIQLAHEGVERWGETIIEQAIEANEMRKEIARAIAAVPDRLQRIVLSRHYLLGQPLFRISMDIHYSYDRVRHLHGWGLQKVELPGEESTSEHIDP